MNTWSINKADALILDETPSHLLQVVVQRTIVVAGGVVGFVATWILIARSTPSVLVLGLLLCGIATTTWLSMRQITLAASRRRSDMNIAVAVFLDLVNVLLAGGAGIETAILTAASAGDGWSFNHIRMTLARAQSSRENYWDALDQSGIDLQVQSLQDVAQSIRIAGEYGGRVRQSLASRSDALRKNNLALIEYEAQRRTERMGIPMVTMFIGFVIFIGYPAFISTVTVL